MLVLGLGLGLGLGLPSMNVEVLASFASTN